jgi:peroxiredoxin (alkyl hydroperoxide reductase subunit C)
MSENSPLKVGQKVPSFQVETYDPVSEDFSAFSLDKAKADKKWTILFFYPADFTFV